MAFGTNRSIFSVSEKLHCPQINYGDTEGEAVGSESRIVSNEYIAAVEQGHFLLPEFHPPPINANKLGRRVVVNLTHIYEE